MFYVLLAMTLIFFFIFGVGYELGSRQAKMDIAKDVKGYLRVDNSVDEIYLFLELTKKPDTLVDGEMFLLKVKKQNYISQK